MSASAARGEQRRGRDLVGRVVRIHTPWYVVRRWSVRDDMGANRLRTGRVWQATAAVVVRHRVRDGRRAGLFPRGTGLEVRTGQ
jgi:hypothetical protein